MNRQQRRAMERAERAKANSLYVNNGAGYGIGQTNAKPAAGQSPQVNPFMIPKDTGLSVISRTFPSNYYVTWDLSTWRAACDQAMKMGYPIAYATMVAWCFESSVFVQSLFTKLAAPIEKSQVFLEDQAGNKIDAFSELCTKDWFKALMKEILFSKFWGFTGLNFDPVAGKVYKYPMQDIDPINRFIRESTYNLYNGVTFADNDNLLYIQPSTSYESFLGWMQPITRSWIQINQNNNNWIAAGRRLAYPFLTVGYPAANESTDADGNTYNPYKAQAEDIAANADPTKGVVYPYTVDAKGEIQKAIEIGLEGAVGTQNAHKIYNEFNKEEKADIMQMIFGGTLTASVGDSGSRALGEVQENQLEAVHAANMEFVISQLNGEFLTKIQKFYKNWPKGAKFSINKAKQWKLDEVVQISPILNANGIRLKPEFFESMGLTADFIEQAPEPTIQQPKQKEPEAELASKGFLKKKFN